jgi:hypothetical protein
MITKQKNLEIQVGDEKKEFISNAWSPMKCFSHLPKIGKAFAIPLSMLTTGDEESMGESIPQALFMLFEQMEEQDVWKLFELIVSDVHVDATRRLDLNTDLDGDLGAILTIVAECLKHNYGSLYSGNGLSSLMTNLMGVTQAAQIE